MDILFVVLTGCSLAMDAFAVAVCFGISQSRIRLWPMLKISLFFGLAQFIMPVIGFYAGQMFLAYIEAFDHWIAFGVLAFIGVKMMLDARCPAQDDSLQSAGTLRLLVLALATSIDALAVGVTMGLVSGEILRPAAIIGLITLLICCGGVLLGKTLGLRLQQKVQIAGGGVLVLLGARILIEHLL